MRKRRVGLSLLLTGCFCFGLASDRRDSASHWPRFRGPNGTGISTDKDVPIQWTEKIGVLWKTNIPGLGNSSPVVWGNRLFVQSAATDGKERLLLCLNTADGRIVWSRTVPGSAAAINPRNTLASSTPATEGERIYALFWDGNALWLNAHDFNGNPIWKRNLGSFASQHGAGASPIVYRNKVIVANDQDSSSVLIALDARTGQMAWEVPRARAVSGACYSTPLLFEEGGKPPELIVASTPGLNGYDPETGRQIWSWVWPFPGRPLRTVASPIYSQGFIFANSGDGGGDRHMIAVQRMISQDSPKVRLVWDSNRLPYVPTMLAWGEHLYWVNDRGVAGCNVAKTGETVWTERLGGNVTASPVLINGRIYAATEDGDVYVFLAEPKFKLLAKNSIGELVRATPAVADNRLFIRGQQHLFCIAEAAGR